MRISVLCNSRAPRKRGYHRWAPPTVLMLWYHSMTSGDTIDPTWTGAEPVLVEPVQTWETQMKPCSEIQERECQVKPSYHRPIFADFRCRTRPWIALHCNRPDHQNDTFWIFLIDFAFRGFWAVLDGSCRFYVLLSDQIDDKNILGCQKMDSEAPISPNQPSEPKSASSSPMPIQCSHFCHWVR